MMNTPEVFITYNAVWRAGAVVTPGAVPDQPDRAAAHHRPLRSPRRRRHARVAAAAAARRTDGLAGHRRRRRARGHVPFTELEARRAAADHAARRRRPGRPALHRRHDRPAKGVMLTPPRASGRGGYVAARARATLDITPVAAAAAALARLRDARDHRRACTARSRGTIVLHALVRRRPAGCAGRGAPASRPAPSCPSMLQMLLRAAAGGARPVRLVRVRQRRGAAADGDRGRSSSAGSRRRDLRGVRLHRGERGDHRQHGRAPAGRAASGGRCPASRSRIRPTDGAGAGRADGEVCVRGPGADEGLLERPEDDRARPLRGRLAAHRRRRPPRRRRLPVHRRPHQGPHHPRRLQRLPARRRGRAARAPGRRAGAPWSAAPTPESGEEVVAFVALAPGADGQRPRIIASRPASACRQYKYPREVRIVDASRSPASARPTARPSAPSSL